MEVSSIITENQYLDYSQSVDALISEMKEAYNVTGMKFDIYTKNIPRQYETPKFSVGYDILDPRFNICKLFWYEVIRNPCPIK